MRFHERSLARTVRVTARVELICEGTRERAWHRDLHPLVARHRLDLSLIHIFYELALNRFNLKPESSVFFDDTAKNVTGAQAVGMHAFQFVDADQARRDLKSLGMNF